LSCNLFLRLARLTSYSIIMLFRKFFITIFLVLISSAAAFAQDGEDPISFDTTIVRLNIGVVDRTRRPITDLNKESFTLYEDGVKQEILSFAPTKTPFSLVMILDMSGSTTGFRDIIKLSAFNFIDALAPDDRVAVIEFYDKVNLLNDFTTNRKTVVNSIKSANGRGKTQLYKSLELALQKLSAETDRRKAIIVLTDGVDTNLQNGDRDLLLKLDESKMPDAIKPENNPTLIEVLNRADAQGVTIYPLALPTGDPAKLIDPTPIQTAMYSAARFRLQTLANRTGGTLNAINRLEEMGKFYAAVAADLRSLYTIEYQPANEKRDGKWREIKIEVNRPELISRTRPGYFAK
jgi:VWFA-related protein